MFPSMGHRSMILCGKDGPNDGDDLTKRHLASCGATFLDHHRTGVLVVGRDFTDMVIVTVEPGRL